MEMNTSVNQNTSTGILIAAPSVIAPDWKPSKHTSTVEWIKYVAVYPYNRTLQSHENAHATTTHSNNG